MAKAVCFLFLTGLLITTCSNNNYPPNTNPGPPQPDYALLFVGPRIQNVNNGDRNLNNGEWNIGRRYLYSARIRWKSNGIFSNNAIINYRISDPNSGYEYFSGSLTTNNGPDFGPGRQGEGLYLNNEFAGFGNFQDFPTDQEINTNSTIRVSYWEDTYFPQQDYIDLRLIDDGEFTNIIDPNGTHHYHQIFKHGNPIDGEVPGDGFDDATFHNDNITLDSQRKDLVVEIDMLPGITLWSYSANILSKLQVIFSEIDMNLIIKWGYLDQNRFSDYGDYLDFGEAVESLVQERDIELLGRNALHVVVSELPSGWNYDLYGINITMIGNIDSWQNSSESEALARQHASDNALDSVGCIIFWRKFETDLQRDGGGGVPWSLTNAFCWTTAHEIGHAIGIWHPMEVSNYFDIMSHAIGFDQNGFQDEFMHFDFHNYQGMAHGPGNEGLDLPSNCICTRDVLGIHTVSISSGWGL